MPERLASDPKAPSIFLFDDKSVQSVLPRYGAHLIDLSDAAALERGVFTAVAGVHELDENGWAPHAKQANYLLARMSVLSGQRH
jgi:hypothetical protein